MDSYMNEHHFGKALPYCLELRRPGVIDLVLEHNLFAEIQDRVLQLLVYDRETAKKRGKQPLRDGDKAQCLRQSSRHGVVIQLLAENTHSVPVRVSHRIPFKVNLMMSADCKSGQPVI